MQCNIDADLPDFLGIGDPRPPGHPRPSAAEITGQNPSHTTTLQPVNPIPENPGRPNVENAIDASLPKSGAPKIQIPQSVMPQALPPPPSVPHPDTLPPRPQGIPLNLVPRLSEDDMVPGFHATMSVEADPEYAALIDPKERVFLRVLEKTGRMAAAAELSGLSLAKINRRITHDPDGEFSKLVEVAKGYRKEILVDEALRRAVHGVDEPVFYMGAVCGYKTSYSDALLSKLLDAYDPEKFRANHKVTVEGQLGIATLVLPALASADDWARMNKGKVIDALPVGDDEDFGSDP